MELEGPDAAGGKSQDAEEGETEKGLPPLTLLSGGDTLMVMAAGDDPVDEEDDIIIPLGCCLPLPPLP